MKLIEVNATLIWTCNKSFKYQLNKKFYTKYRLEENLTIVSILKKKLLSAKV